MRQRQRRVPVNRSDVAEFIAHRNGNLSLCRKAAKFIYRSAGLFSDIDGLRELRAALFEPDERAGCLDNRIAELERDQGAV